MRWVTVAILAIMLGVFGQRASADEVSSQKSAGASQPEVEYAGRVAKKVELDEAAFRELASKLAKSVEAYNPGASIYTTPESQSLEAFRNYCRKLLESGRQLIALHEKWSTASDTLGDSLKKAPAFYRSASQAMREKAETMSFKVINERYLLAADIWEQLALKAEVRLKDPGRNGNSKGIVDLLREEVTFLEDFCKTLDALPKVSGDEKSEELHRLFGQHAEKSDELHRQLKLFRQKLMSEPQVGGASK